MKGKGHQASRLNGRPPGGVPPAKRVCAGTKRDGSPCTTTVTATVDPSQRYCWWHDPAHAEKRKRNASKAGKSKAGAQIKDLDVQLAALYEDTLRGEVETRVAAVLNQIIQSRTKLIEAERRIRDSEELQQRIEALEVVAQREAEGRGYSRRWP